VDPAGYDEGRRVEGRGFSIVTICCTSVGWCESGLGISIHKSCLHRVESQALSGSPRVRERPAGPRWPWVDWCRWEGFSQRMDGQRQVLVMGRPCHSTWEFYIFERFMMPLMGGSS